MRRRRRASVRRGEPRGDAQTGDRRRRSRCRRGGCAPAGRRSAATTSRTPRRIQSAPAPFGPPNLCAGERQQVDAERLDRHRNLADRLHGVGVKERAVRARDAPRARRSAESCRPRCWRASPTRARSRGRWPPRSASGDDDAARRRRAAIVDVQPRRSSAFTVLRTASCSMPVVTRCRRPVGLERLGRAAKREVVGLGAAAREDDLARVGADQRGDRRRARRRRTALARWPKAWTRRGVAGARRAEHARHRRRRPPAAGGVVAL